MQLINLQSNEEFASHMLNRDTWTHAAVKKLIQATFVFWQVAHPHSHTLVQRASRPCMGGTDPMQACLAGAAGIFVLLVLGQLGLALAVYHTCKTLPCTCAHRRTSLNLLRWTAAHPDRA